MLHWYCKVTHNLKQFFFPKATYNLGLNFMLIYNYLICYWDMKIKINITMSQLNTQSVVSIINKILLFRFVLYITNSLCL